MNTDDYITTSEVCRRLGVSRRTVMTWKKQGLITPSGKVGPGKGMLMWDPNEIAQYAEVRRVGR